MKQYEWWVSGASEQVGFRVMEYMIERVVLWVLACTVVSTGISAAQTSSYSGQESREIKSLSELEVEGLLSGEGMGYAKAAELNGYPGPAHVPELAEQLDLTDEQLDETGTLFSEMEGQARELGAELVAAERRLDRMFRDQEADAVAVSHVVADVGDIEAQLRFAHLEAHLRQIEVLSEEQVEEYMRRRGYGDRHPSGDHQHRHGG